MLLTTGPTDALTLPGADAWVEFRRFFCDRGARVFGLVTGIWILSIFDLCLTIMAHRESLLDESNPLARYLLDHGEVYLGLFKLGLLALGTYPLIRLRNHRISELGAWVALGIHVLVAIRWHGCYELYAMTIHSGPDLMHLWKTHPPV